MATHEEMKSKMLQREAREAREKARDEELMRELENSITELLDHTYVPMDHGFLNITEKKIEEDFKGDCSGLGYLILLSTSLAREGDLVNKEMLDGDYEFDHCSKVAIRYLNAHVGLATEIDKRERGYTIVHSHHHLTHPKF